MREIVNASDLDMRARYDYAPYGQRTKLAGDLDADFGFTDHYEHALTGLTLAPFRAYDSGLGRWLSRDPIEEGGGMNLYSYTYNRPSSLWDPMGLDAGDKIASWLEQNFDFDRAIRFWTGNRLSASDEAFVQGLNAERVNTRSPLRSVSISGSIPFSIFGDGRNGLFSTFSGGFNYSIDSGGSVFGQVGLQGKHGSESATKTFDGARVSECDEQRVSGWNVTSGHARIGQGSVDGHPENTFSIGWKQGPISLSLGIDFRRLRYLFDYSP
jgi:RHS repeat-associated protein